MKKLLIITVVALALIFGSWAMAENANSVVSSSDTSAICTQEAKICPDGTSVGRTGSNCEFAPCPQLVGGDKDAHGCIGSAGYSWCAPLNKCIRPWLEKCQTKASSTKPIVKKTATQIDAECIINTLDKRDTVMIIVWDKYSMAVKKALEARRLELKAAYTQTETKLVKNAISKAWKNYSLTVAKAKVQFNKEKTAAWKQYNTGRKSCRTTANTDMTTEKADGNL